MASTRSVAVHEFRGCSCEIYELSLCEMESFRAPWICLLDAFYYHSDGLERPSIASGRVGEILVSYWTLASSRSIPQKSTARRR